MPKIFYRIPFEFREIVQCTAIRTGGKKEWEFLWERTLNPLILQINLKTIYLSLGCTREPWLINRYLEKSLDGNITLQNVPYVWKSIAHPVGLNIGFIFLKTNWEQIYKSYQYIYSNLNSIFEDFLSMLSTKVDLDNLTLFYRRHKENLRSVSSLMLSVVDRIKWKISWMDKYLETVIALLSENSS